MTKEEAELEHSGNVYRRSFCPIIKENCRKDCRWFIPARIQQSSYNKDVWNTYKDDCGFQNRYVEMI